MVHPYAKEYYTVIKNDATEYILIWKEFSLYSLSKKKKKEANYETP